MKKILILGASSALGFNYVKKNKKDLLYCLIRDKKINRNKFKKICSKKINKIFYKRTDNLKKKLYNLKFEIIINFSTRYTTEDSPQEIKKIIVSNVIYPSIVFSSINFKYIKKIINFGTFMENRKNINYNPCNYYAASKAAFDKIMVYFNSKNLNTKIYKLKLFDTYQNNDERKKILPILKKFFKKKQTFKLISSNLYMNFINFDDINKAIKIIIKKNIKPGEYILKAKKNLNLLNLINSFNKKNKNKIKFKILSKKNIIPININTKKLPYWRQTKFLEKDFNEIINENY